MIMTANKTPACTNATIMAMRMMSYTVGAKDTTTTRCGSLAPFLTPGFVSKVM